MRTVLVVADDRDVREVLRRHLEHVGLSVLTAAHGAEALDHLENVRPDLVLLDLDLSDVDGTEVLASAARTAPVIAIAARSDPEDRIAGLRLGASDYIAKPFHPTEVVLRVRAVLTCRQGTGTLDGVRSFGDGLLLIDEIRHRATFSGEDLLLTPHQWRLLLVLASAPGRVFLREELVERLAGYRSEGSDALERAVDTHVKNLRHRIGPEGARVIETVVGFGYRLGLTPD